MKNPSTFLKGLIMTVVTILASMIASGGLPTTSLGWIALGITLVGTMLVYVAKNAVFPSVSVLGKVSLQDLLSGLIMAVASGLSSWAASALTSQPVDWNSLLTLMVSVVVGYLAKTFASGTSES